MATKTNEIVRSKQNQEQKKELIDKYGALLHKNPKKLQDIMRWRLYKIGKVDCLSLNEYSCDLVLVSERDHRQSGEFRLTSESENETTLQNQDVIIGIGRCSNKPTDPNTKSYPPGQLLTQAKVKISDLKYEKCDFPKLLPHKGPSQQSFEKQDEFDHHNFERKGFRLFCQNIVLDLVASDYNDWLNVFDKEMKLERVPYSQNDNDRIIGWQAPRNTWPGTVSRCWTCGDTFDDKGFFICDCCGGLQCEQKDKTTKKCKSQLVPKLNFEASKKTNRACQRCIEKLKAYEVIGIDTLKKASALSIYIRLDYGKIMI